MQIIFIGQRFYSASQTTMSPFYEIRRNGPWERSGLGDIQTTVESGETVTIRPATQKELAQAESMLARLSF